MIHAGRASRHARPGRLALSRRGRKGLDRGGPWKLGGRARILDGPVAGSPAPTAIPTTRPIRPGASTMDPIERRTFLRTAAAMTTASSLLGNRPAAAFADEPPAKRWK